jgi:crotonobetainyl-CoA:carnitine CoA-transferase CaiB-like acyl-CoA transferase
VSLSLRPTDPGNQQHEHLNRGKKTMLLDLHSPDGLRVFKKLAEQSHVVMQNFAKGTAERYGIGYQQLRSHNSELIYFSLSAYGYGGPMETYRGYEGNAQAVTGLMDRFGGDAAPLGQPYLLDDYGTGVRGAFAIGLALFHRLRSGRGQHVNISLVETATYHQAAYLLEYAGRVWNEPRGVRALGSAPWQRMYRAADAWFFLGARDAAQLTQVQGLEGISHLDGDDLEHALEARLRSEPVDVWVTRLRGAGVGAHRLVTTEELMEDPWARQHGLSLTQTIPGLGSMRMPGVAVRMSRTPLRVGAPVNPVGSDGPEVLRQIGLDAEVDGLLASGALRVRYDGRDGRPQWGVEVAPPSTTSMLPVTNADSSEAR